MKLFGRDINVSIIGQSRQYVALIALYGRNYFGKSPIILRITKNAMPIPKIIMINGKLPFITSAVVEDKSVTIFAGICIVHFVIYL